MAKERKKFKDTKIGSWLKEKAPNVLEAVGDMLPDRGTLGILKNIINKNSGGKLSPEDIAEFNRMHELELQEFELHNKNTESARNMQMTALGQEDVFSKRFVYYFAIIIFVSCVILIAMLFFLSPPAENVRIIDMALGTLLGAGISGIINFFFGSSMGSKDKTKEILNIRNNGRD